MKSLPLLIIAAAALFTGCVTTPSRTTCETVNCEKCKTTWVLVPTHSGKAVSYTRKSRTVCSECESAISNYVKTGVLASRCNHCGTEMTCTKHN